MVRTRAYLRQFAGVVASALVGGLLITGMGVGVSATAAHAATPAPSWWDGDCDANHWNATAQSLGWTGVGAYRLGASYMDVPVCGPRRSGDGAPDVRWSRPGWGHFEWECVELSMRFMAQIYGVSAYGANGNQVVDNYSTSYGGGLQKVANGTTGAAPVPGDVISFDDPGNPYVTKHFGHTAVVAGTTVDNTGNGTLTLLSQNDTVDGWRKLTVTNWNVGGFGYEVATGWLHDPAGRGGPGIVSTADGPAVASAGDGTTDVFARGGDDALWTRHESPDGTWGDWTSLGGGITAAPAAAAAQPGSITVVVRGRSNTIWTKTSTGGVWSPWAQIDGAINAAPSLVSSGPGTLDLLVRGTDYGLWARHLDTDKWGAWQSLGGGLSSAPSTASAATGALDVFVRGNDNALWTRHDDGGTWTGWQSLGGVLKSAPGATASATGVVDVFVLGTDRALWTRQFDGTAWNAWKSYAWTVSSPVALVSLTPGAVDVYARGTDAALWTSSITTSMSPPVSLGGVIK